MNTIITDDVGSCLDKYHSRYTGFSGSSKHVHLNNEICKVLSKVFSDLGTWSFHLTELYFTIL